MSYVIEKGVSVEQAVSELELRGMSQEEMNRIIESILKERMDFVKEKGMEAVGPLMGLVMKELRGKVDGKRVNLALKKRIQEICI